jgi:hypothetical protein
MRIGFLCLELCMFLRAGRGKPRPYVCCRARAVKKQGTSSFLTYPLLPALF